MSAKPITSDNTLDLLFCGTDFFPALIKAIDGAQREILLETYIFTLDPTAISVQEALIKAAQRGVQVQLVTDWHGTGPHTLTKLELAFQPAGVGHRIFNPWFRRGYPRTHRKLCVVDREVAFVGGININDDLLFDLAGGQSLPAPRWDFAVRVQGPLVQQIWHEVSQQWQRLGVLDWKAMLAKQRNLRLRRAPKTAPALVSFVVRDNFRNRRTIQNAYLNAMNQARSEILLATPYFAPGRKFIKALANAARRGVKVTLLIGFGQYRLQDMVAHSFYPKLLKNGVHLVEYRKTELHGKVAVIDDTWATVGSSNCDGLSLFLNQEANLVINDATFAGQLKAHIMQAVNDGVVIQAADYAHLTWYKRAWYDAAFWLYKSVMRIVTLGHYG